MQKPVEITLAIQASANKRFLNYVIDTVFILLLSPFIGAILELMSLSISPENPLFWILMWLIYYFVMEFALQRTIGKYITGVKVVSAEGRRPRIDKLLLRTFMRIIPFGILSINEKKLGMFWRDTASGVYFIDMKKYKEVLALKNSFEEIGTEQI